MLQDTDNFHFSHFNSNSKIRCSNLFQNVRFFQLLLGTEFQRPVLNSKSDVFFCIEWMLTSQVERAYFSCGYQKMEKMKTWTQTWCLPTGAFQVHRHRGQSGGHPDLVPPLLFCLCVLKCSFCRPKGSVQTYTETEINLVKTHTYCLLYCRFVFFIIDIDICSTLVNCTNVCTGILCCSYSPMVWPNRGGFYPLLNSTQRQELKIKSLHWLYVRGGGGGRREFVLPVFTFTKGPQYESSKCIAVHKNEGLIIGQL